MMKNIVYLFAGIYFGVLLYKSEAVSWYRVQEMFLFQSFHMYGLIFSAIAVGAISLFLFKKFGWKSLENQPMTMPDKKISKANLLGGIIFGLGWSLAGACPGPIFVLIGSGFSFMFLTLLGALVGTWVYSVLRNCLPHA